jgi:hypothetical protein
LLAMSFVKVVGRASVPGNEMYHALVQLAIRAGAEKRSKVREDAFSDQ